MNLASYVIDFIKKRIKSTQKLTENPNSDRLIFINDDEKIRIYRTKIGKVWLVGNGSELLNFFTEQQAIGYNNNPIYNRNNRNTFWGKSTLECNIHRIHSRVPSSIIQMMNNIMGKAEIKENTGMWEEIAKANKFDKKLYERARPLCWAEGYGAWKVNADKEYSDYPLIEYYEAENVDYVLIGDMIVGVMYKSFYKDKHNKDYALIETRFVKDKNSYITYELFKLNKNNDIEKVPLETIENLAYLKDKETVIPGLNRILGVPVKYIESILYPGYGESLLTDYSDLFDMIDEAFSQLGQTNRVSTPVTWLNPEVVTRGPNGATGYQDLYNRQIIMKEGIPDGEGFQNQDIVTEQPQLNFDQYIRLIEFAVNSCLTGRISPASMGIDISRKDNAMAQREKEKVTIETRNAFIDSERGTLKELVEISLMMKEWMDTGSITLDKDYDVSVEYEDYGAPTFEEKRKQLLDMLTRGAISPKKFVDDYYGDEISEEEKIEQVNYISEQQSMDNLFKDTGMNDETGIKQFNKETNITEEETVE